MTLRPGERLIDTLIGNCRRVEMALRDDKLPALVDLPPEVMAFFTPAHYTVRTPGIWTIIALYALMVLGAAGLSVTLVRLAVDVPALALNPAAAQMAGSALAVLAATAILVGAALARSVALRAAKGYSLVMLAFGTLALAAAVAGLTQPVGPALALLAGIGMWWLLGSRAFFIWGSYQLAARQAQAQARRKATR